MYQNQIPNPEPQYNSANPYPQDNRRQEYLETVNDYGSIIKDLTETDILLETFELRLRGKTKNDKGEVTTIPGAECYIKTDQAARDYVNLIRSVVNRHNDFSYYEASEGYSLIAGANYQINRWLMLQGDVIPTRYRSKISFEAMALISASVHKAMEGRILRWTKGTFGENRQYNDNAQQKTGLIGSIVNMFSKRR